MQIILQQSEIEAAVVEYIKSQGISISGCNVDVQFKSGRLDSGSTATIEITKGKVETSDVPTPRAVTASPEISKPVAKKETLPEPTTSVIDEIEEQAETVDDIPAPKKKLFGRMKDKDSA
jgi:hypothetical protein